MGILHRKASVTHISTRIDIIIHNKQSGIRLLQQIEADIQRPQVSLAVVLNKTLKVDPRLERIRNTGAENGGHKISTWQVYIIHRQTVLGIELVAYPQARVFPYSDNGYLQKSLPIWTVY